MWLTSLCSWPDSGQGWTILCGWPDVALAKFVLCVFSLSMSSVTVTVVKGEHRNLQVGYCSYLFESDVQQEHFLTVKTQVENFCHMLFTWIAFDLLPAAIHYTIKSHALRTQSRYREHDLDTGERHSTLISMKGVTMHQWCRECM